MSRFVIVILTMLVAATGCTDRGREALSRGANGDCFRAWNAEGNDANRATVAAENGGWQVRVSTSQLSHPADGLTGAGCSYVLFSSTHWVAYGGLWENDGDFRWQPGARAARRRTPAQTIGASNAVLQRGGRVVPRPPELQRPVSGREWRAVIDDWYDNGVFDRVHRCSAVREAIERLPTGARDYSSVGADFAAYAEEVCKRR